MRLPPPPPVWITLMQLWRTPARDADKFWRALYHARWTTSAAFRQRLVHFEGQPPDVRLRGVEDFLRHHVRPAEVIDVLVDLAKEKLISWRDSVRWQELVLQCVDSAGEWKYPRGRQPA